MKYIERINKDLLSNLKNLQDVTIFGQNVNSGSFLSGLTKDIDSLKSAKIINSTNCENTLGWIWFRYCSQKKKMPFLFANNKIFGTFNYGSDCKYLQFIKNNRV